MRHLNLVGHVMVTVPFPGGGFQQKISAYNASLVDGELQVQVPNLLHRYGDTGVVAYPAVSLSGSTVSFDLTVWSLVDLATERSVGNLTFSPTEPTSPLMVDIVERYLRDARGLSTFELAAWATRVLDEVNSR